MVTNASFSNFSPAKTQFYLSDGFGRDSYIYNINGGFCPEKSPTKVHPIGKLTQLFQAFAKDFYLSLGSFVIQKSRPADHIPQIHSKPVIYSNNGGGRDTYISQNDGGFRPMHRAGYGKATFFNQLRHYAPIEGKNSP